MSMKRLVKTDALVLRKRSLMDKDIMLTLFTKDYGKMTVVAKGVKKLTSRRSAHTQTGNLVSLELYTKSDRYYLQDTNIISAFSQIKIDHEKVNYLYQMLFIIDRLLPEQQTEPEIYNIAVRFLIYSSKSQKIAPEKFAGYLHDIIRVLGYGTEDSNLTDILRNIEEIINEKIPEHVII